MVLRECFLPDVDEDGFAEERFLEDLAAAFEDEDDEDEEDSESACRFRFVCRAFLLRKSLASSSSRLRF